MHDGEMKPDPELVQQVLTGQQYSDLDAHIQGHALALLQIIQGVDPTDLDTQLLHSSDKLNNETLAMIGALRDRLNTQWQAGPPGKQCKHCKGTGREPKQDEASP